MTFWQTTVRRFKRVLRYQQKCSFRKSVQFSADSARSVAEPEPRLTLPTAKGETLSHNCNSSNPKNGTTVAFISNSAGGF